MPRSNARQSLVASVAPLFDGLCVALAGWLAYATRWGKWNLSIEYMSVLVLGTGLVLVLLPATGAYRSWRDQHYWQNTANVLPGLFFVAVFLMTVGTLTKTTAFFSRLWMAYWLAYTLGVLFLFRWTIAILVNVFRVGQSRPIRVLLVGDGTFAQTVATRLRDAVDAHWEVVDIISPYSAVRQVAHGQVVATPLHEMEALISNTGNRIDEVWIAMDNTSLDRQDAVIRVLRTSSLTVRYVPDLSMLSLLNHEPSDVAGMTVVNLNASPLTGYNTLIKAAVDKLLALAALTLTAPLLLLISALIKFDSPGPILFRQKRHGWDGRVIHVLKFRTMRESPADADDARQAQFNDPRVTAVGRILRRTSLDELPQFINVLRGEMSVVGPRPHPLSLNYSYAGKIDAYMQRHRVKPGITGWAQVHGLRGETETLEKMQRRIEFDLYYIEHWSLWLDIRIILLTLAKGWSDANAY